METATSTSLFLNLVSSAVTQPPWAFCLLMVSIFNLESVYGQRSAACEASVNLRLPDQVLSTEYHTTGDIALSAFGFNFSSPNTHNKYPTGVIGGSYES